MSEYFYQEQAYNWLREYLPNILIGILLLFFVIGCCFIVGASLVSEEAER